jgi:hypothetical protein
MARAALAAAQIELEVRVAGRDLRHLGLRLGGERGASEVRVDDDARRVEHPPQPRAQARPRACDEVDRRVVDRVTAVEQLLAPRLQLGARDRGRQPVDGREVAQPVAVAHTERRRSRTFQRGVPRPAGFEDRMGHRARAAPG